MRIRSNLNIASDVLTKVMVIVSLTREVSVYQKLLSARVQIIWKIRE